MREGERCEPGSTAAAWPTSIIHNADNDTPRSTVRSHTLLIHAQEELPMPNLAAAFKDEIRRLAKKEIKTQTEVLRQATTQYRHEIALLKRQMRDQQRQIARIQSSAGKGSATSPSEEQPAEAVRFSARSVRAQRARLGLSARDYGRLVGVSGLTIYNWEHNKSRPRKAQFDALVTLRGLGKREARAKLEALDTEE